MKLILVNSVIFLTIYATGCSSLVDLYVNAVSETCVWESVCEGIIEKKQYINGEYFVVKNVKNKHCYWLLESEIIALDDYVGAFVMIDSLGMAYMQSIWEFRKVSAKKMSNNPKDTDTIQMIHYLTETNNELRTENNKLRKVNNNITRYLLGSKCEKIDRRQLFHILGQGSAEQAEALARQSPQGRRRGRRGQALTNDICRSCTSANTSTNRPSSH
jgi:hypothetical protein